MEGNLVLAVHRLGHVDIHYDLAAAAHSRDDSVAWQADRQVHVVPGHSVQAGLHDQGKWLTVGSVDDLVVLKRVLDLV